MFQLFFIFLVENPVLKQSLFFPIGITPSSYEIYDILSGVFKVTF